MRTRDGFHMESDLIPHAYIDTRHATPIHATPRQQNYGSKPLHHVVQLRNATTSATSGTDTTRGQVTA